MFKDQNGRIHLPCCWTVSTVDIANLLKSFLAILLVNQTGKNHQKFKEPARKLARLLVIPD